MSAYAASKTHVDLLVTAGLRLPDWSGPAMVVRAPAHPDELDAFHQPGTHEGSSIARCGSAPADQRIG